MPRFVARRFVAYLPETVPKRRLSGLFVKALRSVRLRRRAAAIQCDGAGSHTGLSRLKSSLSRRTVLVLGAAGLLSACTSAKPLPAPPTPTTPDRLTTAAILAAINGTRAANGKPPLRYNEKLEEAARSQARLMASRDQLSHDLGVTLRQRVSAAGYDGAVGENVAGGHTSLEQAIEGWLNSPKHRETLLSTRFVEFGLAVATVPPGKKSRYGTYWAFIAGGSFDAWRA